MFFLRAGIKAASGQRGRPARRGHFHLAVVIWASFFFGRKAFALSLSVGIAFDQRTPSHSKAFVDFGILEQNGTQ